MPGTTITSDVEASDIIDNVKDSVQDKEDITIIIDPPYHQYLTSTGKQLEDSSVEASDMIDIVKVRVQDKEDITIVGDITIFERLVFAGKLLEDGCTISEYDIHVQNESILQLVLRLGGGMLMLRHTENMFGDMQIFMRNLDSETIPLDIEAPNMIDSVKAKTQSDQPSLVFAGKLLEDGRTFSEYDIHVHKEYIIQLVLRLGEGMQMLRHTEHVFGDMRIFVRNLDSKTVLLDDEASDVIDIFVETITLDVAASDIFDTVEAGLVTRKASS